MIHMINYAFLNACPIWVHTTKLCFICICRLRSCKQRQGLLRVVHVRCSAWNHFYLFEGVLYYFSKQSLFSKLGKFSCGSNLESRFHSSCQKTLKNWRRLQLGGTSMRRPRDDFLNAAFTCGNAQKGRRGITLFLPVWSMRAIAA